MASRKSTSKVWRLTSIFDSILSLRTVHIYNSSATPLQLISLIQQPSNPTKQAEAKKRMDVRDQRQVNRRGGISKLCTNVGVVKPDRLRRWHMKISVSNRKEENAGKCKFKIKQRKWLYCD